MKRLNGMKKTNKWTFLVVGLVLCAVAGFTHTSQVTAAEEDVLDLMTLEYLDPFDLTVTSVSAPQAVQAALGSVPRSSSGRAVRPGTLETSTPVLADSGVVSPVVILSDVDPLDIAPYAQPPKIWIPYRPTFRSPCTPSW